MTARIVARSLVLLGVSACSPSFDSVEPDDEAFTSTAHPTSEPAAENHVDVTEPATFHAPGSVPETWRALALDASADPVGDSGVTLTPTFDADTSTDSGGEPPKDAGTAVPVDKCLTKYRNLGAVAHGVSLGPNVGDSVGVKVSWSCSTKTFVQRQNTAGQACGMTAPEACAGWSEGGEYLARIERAATDCEAKIVPEKTLNELHKPYDFCDPPYELSGGKCLALTQKCTNLDTAGFTSDEFANHPLSVFSSPVSGEVWTVDFLGWNVPTPDPLLYNGKCPSYKGAKAFHDSTVSPFSRLSTIVNSNERVVGQCWAKVSPLTPNP